MSSAGAGPEARSGSLTGTVVGGDAGSTTSALRRLATASPSLAPLLEIAARAAVAEAPVLVLGPPGSGRSTLARAIHQASSRRHGPLVEMDPGGVPATLLESDLFGYEAGAFTGATTRRVGRVERADGGTLLLDPVESLTLEAQPKLLRLLSERRYHPLGGSDREANVRFVAVGGEDLPQRCATGALREDFYYRLAVMVLPLPSLADRREDVPMILDAMLDDLGRRYGRPELTLTAAARRWMGEHPWPGNLRQLRNVVERELVLRADSTLDPRPPRTSAAAPPVTLEEAEREHIRQALAYARGHQGRAAELLGISRKALWAKRKRLDLP